MSSSLGGQVSVLERGGAHGYPSTDPYDDGQVPLGPRAEGAFARDRRMSRLWSQLGEHDRTILSVHYTASFPSEAGGPGVEGYFPRRKWPLGFDGIFSPFSGVVLWLAARDGALPRVLALSARKPPRKPGTDYRPQIRSWRDRAEHLVRASHEAYYAVVAQDGEACRESVVSERKRRVELFLAEVGL